MAGDAVYDYEFSGTDWELEIPEVGAKVKLYPSGLEDMWMCHGVITFVDDFGEAPPAFNNIQELYQAQYEPLSGTFPFGIRKDGTLTAFGSHQDFIASMRTYKRDAQKFTGRIQRLSQLAYEGVMGYIDAHEPERAIAAVEIRELVNRVSNKALVALYEAEISGEAGEVSGAEAISAESALEASGQKLSDTQILGLIRKKYTYRDICRAIESEAIGGELVRSSGEHRIYKIAGTAPIPHHLSEHPKPGILPSFCHKSGLSPVVLARALGIKEHLLQ